MADGLVTFEVTYKTQRYMDAAAGLRALAKDLSKTEEMLFPVARKELFQFLENVVAALTARHGNPYPGGTTGNSLSLRSGNLVESLQQSIFVKGSNLDNMIGEIGGAFYARIHETGGTITPKKGKYLTIPLPAALNSNGTPIKSKARDWDKTFILKSKKGNLLIVRRDGRHLTPLYLLKTSVTIPARLNLGSTVEAGLPRFIDELGDKLVRALLAA